MPLKALFIVLWHKKKRKEKKEWKKRKVYTQFDIVHLPDMVMDLFPRVQDP